MHRFFDVNTTLVSIFGYKMSPIEFIGTVLNILCVYLLTIKKMINWPVGIAATIFFGILFYQLHLYADLFEQGYYLVTGFFGWAMWMRGKRMEDGPVIVERNTSDQNWLWVCGIALVSVIATWPMTMLDNWFPGAFPEPASYPLLDTTTTIMSFAAQFLLMKRRLENWMLWIAVDVIGIWLYWQKDVPVISGLYCVFLYLAIKGYFDWRKSWRNAFKPES